MVPLCHFGSSIQRTTGGMVSEVVIWEERRTPGDSSVLSFLVILVASWIIAVVVGVLLGWFCCRKAIKQPRADFTPETVRAWERLALEAIRFVSKRRRVGLAFSNYRDYSLRSVQGSRPTTERQLRRRASTPPPVLHEGPAITNGRSDQGRAQRDQRTG